MLDMFLYLRFTYLGQTMDFFFFFLYFSFFFVFLCNEMCAYKEDLGVHTLI